MFEIGDYIIYGQKGVCRVGEITHLDMEGIDKDRLYYIIFPVNDERSRVYFPTDSNVAGVRKVMTKDEVRILLDGMREVELIDGGDFRKQEEIYRKALAGCDCKSLIRVIKTIYLRKQERIRCGKKITATDARYLKQAEDKLYGELAFVLGMKKSEMEEYIVRYINNQGQ
jgi:CarD family transcriptional regulator